MKTNLRIALENTPSIKSSLFKSMKMTPPEPAELYGRAINLHKALTLMFEQLEAELNAMEQYHEKHGDLYARDKSGKILHDENGFPVFIHFPSRDQQFMSLLKQLIYLEEEAFKRAEGVEKSAAKHSESATVMADQIDFDAIFRSTGE